MTFDDLVREFREEEDPVGLVASLRLVKEGLELILHLQSFSATDPRTVIVRFTEPIDWNLTVGFVDGLREEFDHPLLWIHTQAIDALYFNSPASDPAELLRLLYETHHQLFRGCDSREPHFQTALEMLKGMSGQLASGPRSLIELYQKTAAPFMRLSVVRGPERADSRRRLFFLGETFVVCRHALLVDPSEK